METAFTPANLLILEEAIATGTLEVYYGDKKVRYRSLKEMLEIRDLMLGVINPPTDTTQPSGRRLADYHSGL